MKRLLALALVLAPTAAYAAPGTVTGKVSVLYPRCFRGPCPAFVRVLGDDGKFYGVSGEYRDDLKAFDGKTVTVKGDLERSSIDASGFLPGKTKDFVAGTVETVPFRCPPGRICIALARPDKVYINEGGRKILVPEPLATSLRGAAGAQVIVPGTVYQTRCAPNTRCIGSEPELRVTEGRNLMIKGRLEKLPRGMNGQTHTLTFPSGKSILVSGKKWADRDGATVWLSGKMSEERISGVPMLISKKASRPVMPEPQINPWGPLGPDGSNVSRGADTAGGVAGSSTTAGSETTSAGTRR